ncbi:MAG: c-type cytochrome domain-containing protein [Verrucomicrobiales bacterium]
MSTFIKRESPRPTGVKFAWICGLIWALLVAAIWIAYRNADGEGGGLLNFVARFHVVLVHFPIGIVMLALIMEGLSYFTAFSHLRNSIPFTLWLALFGTIGATVLGYLLMRVEDYGGRAMTFHMWFGLSVVVLVLLSLIFYLAGRKALYTLSLVGAVFTTVAAGHFGGAMTHDSDYLTEYAPEAAKPLLTLGLASRQAEPAHDHSEEAEGTAVTAAVEEPEPEPEKALGEQVVYTSLVVPILEAKCNDCHNENKIKGKLRMDTHELLMAGAEGSDFPTIIPGNADDSELIIRVSLPEDDSDFMPTKGENLTSEELEILRLWIDAGAGAETTLAELGDDPSIEATALAVAALHAESEKEGGDAGVAIFQSVWDTLSPEEREMRMNEVMAAAERYRFSVMPVSAEDDRLRVNVINAAGEFGDEEIKFLEPVADRIVWLDLARSQITDEAMKTVGKMRALERLHLENTKVTDTGIAELSALVKLEYLNLYGTEVGDGIFATFENMPELKKVYLWQTNVDPSVARAYERAVNLEINTGVEVSPVETAAQDKPSDSTPEPDAAEAEETPGPKETPKAKPEAKVAAGEAEPKAKANPEKAKAKPKPADAPPVDADDEKAPVKPQAKAGPETQSKPVPKAAEPTKELPEKRPDCD